ELPQNGLRDLDPALGRLANLVAIHDLPGDRLVLGRDDGDLGDTAGHALADGLEEPSAAGDLIQEDEDGPALPVRGRTSPRIRLGAHGLRLPAAPATAGSGAPTSASLGPRI